jgi:hypothetical protein
VYVRKKWLVTLWERYIKIIRNQYRSKQRQHLCSTKRAFDITNKVIVTVHCCRLCWEDSRSSACQPARLTGCPGWTLVCTQVPTGQFCSPQQQHQHTSNQQLCCSSAADGPSGVSSWQRLVKLGAAAAALSQPPFLTVRSLRGYALECCNKLSKHI